MKIKPQKIYAPIYHNKDKFIVLVTGGRGSGKSFNVSTFIERLLFEVRHPSPEKRIVHQVLYTRYTMVSAHISRYQDVIGCADGQAEIHSRYNHIRC